MTSDLTAIQSMLSGLNADSNLSVSVINAMGDGISVVDRDFRVIFQNQVHQEMVRGSFFGENCYRAYNRRESICPDCPVLSAFQDGRAHRITKRSVTDLPVSHVEIMASPLVDRDGELIAGIEIVRDVSEQVAIQEQVQNLNLDLSAKAKELETFNYSLTHDMRNPMSQIRMATGTLKDALKGVQDDDVSYSISALNQASDRMEKLIDSMINLSRATISKIDGETLDLTRMADEIMLSLQLLEPERNVEIEIEKGLIAWGDEALIRASLQNLLENAWKFTMNRETTLIRVFRKKGDEDTFVVQDNGIGFSMEDVAEIFEPFKRLNGSSPFRGSGIGLATTRRIIERHGGTIHAEATPDQGATFTFTLPGPD